MRRHVKTMLAGAASALVLGAGALPALAQSDDQARLDAAIDAFEQRMTDAGWVGEPVDEEGDDEEVDEEGGEDTTIGDDEFDACFGELATVFEGSTADDAFPGQTGLSESLEFTYTPEGVPETTEEFSFDLGDDETVTAIALSVDDSGTELLDTFVDIIGAKETGECMREAMEADMAADTTADDGVPPMEFDFAIENEADLGVGERSARLQFGFEADFLGMPMVFDIGMYLARTDHDLVMVMHGTFGDEAATSGFDPLVELQTLVDSL